MSPSSRACRAIRPDLGVVAGDEDELRLLALDVRELRLEVLIALRVRLVRHDRPAHALEGLGEVVRQTHAVVVLVVAEDRGLREMLRLLRELRDDHPLEGIDVADAEDVVADLRDLGIGGGGTDHRHARVLADRGRGQTPAARHLAQHRDDAVLRDELVDGGRRFLGLALVVLHQNVDLLAADAALRVQVVHEELDPVLGRDPERGGGSRQRAVLPDLDLGFTFGAAGERPDQGEQDEKRKTPPWESGSWASLRAVSV